MKKNFNIIQHKKLITFNECIFTSTRFKSKTCFTFEKKIKIIINNNNDN